MPFQKGNKLGAKKYLKRPLGKMIGFRGYEGQQEKLKAVPDWQERLREYVDRLISRQSDSNAKICRDFLFQLLTPHRTFKRWKPLALDSLIFFLAGEGLTCYSLQVSAPATRPPTPAPPTSQQSTTSENALEGNWV
jgi:hypothetical protein